MAIRQDNNLDAEELFALALRDIQSGQHDGAISKLKQALVLDDKNPRIHFLLAAEYAEIKLLDRAVEGMQRALQLDPDMAAARFQLGLLHIAQHNLSDARKAWAPLDQLASDNVYRLFKSALLDMNDGNDSAAIPVLEKAMQVESGNEALRREVAKVLEAARSRTAPTAASLEPEQTESHTFLHRYGDTVDDS